MAASFYKFFGKILHIIVALMDTDIIVEAVIQEMLIYHFECFRLTLFREIKSHFSRDNQPRSSTTIENTDAVPVFGIFDMLN